MRQKARPQLGYHDLRVGVQQPAVQRRDDVGILVRGEYVVQLFQLDVATRGQCQRHIGQVAARVDQCAAFAMDDQELIGLDAVAGDQVAEHQAFMMTVIVKGDWLAGHGVGSRGWRVGFVVEWHSEPSIAQLALGGRVGRVAYSLSMAMTGPVGGRTPRHR